MIDLSQYNVDQIIRAQTIVRRWLHRKSPLTFSFVLQYAQSSCATDARRRIRALREIAETERSYVGGLRLAFGDYLPMLLTCNSASFNVNTIFGGLAEITSIHEGFLQLLEARLAQWPQEQRVADLFLAFVPTVASFYSPYVIKYEEAAAMLGEALRSPHIQHALQLVRNGLDPAAVPPALANLPLESLLIMPIQRLPRYVLLLRELQKLTPSDHVDCGAIQEAQALCSETTLYINQLKRQNDCRVKLLQLEATIHKVPQTLAVPDRMIIAQGVFTVRISGQHKALFLLVLFSDALLFASGAKSPDSGFLSLSDATANRPLFHSIHPINKCLLTEKDVRIAKFRSAVRSTVRIAPFILTFTDTTTNPPAVTSFYIYASNQTEKAQWIGDIRSHIQQAAIRRQHSLSHIFKLN